MGNLEWGEIEIVLHYTGPGLESHKVQVTCTFKQAFQHQNYFILHASLHLFTFSNSTAIDKVDTVV